MHSSVVISQKKQFSGVGVSNLATKKKRSSIFNAGSSGGTGDDSVDFQEFQERFKGKTTLMNKDGHLGVVQNTSKPIPKDAVNITPIQKQRNDYLNHSIS